jgi:hypothetical protein
LAKESLVLELCEVIAVLGQGIESKRSLNPIFQITTLRVVDLIAIAGASLIEKVSSSTITLKVQLASKLLTLYNEAVKSLLIGKPLDLVSSRLNLDHIMDSGEDIFSLFAPKLNPNGPSSITFLHSAM